MNDGNYLYRRSPSDWWRACTVRNGKLYASWRATPAPLVNGWLDAPNEFVGPLAEDDRDWLAASADSMGRLFREPSTPPVATARR